MQSWRNYDVIENAVFIVSKVKNANSVLVTNFIKGWTYVYNLW